MKPQVEDLVAVRQSQLGAIRLQRESCGKIGREDAHLLELIFRFFARVFFLKQCCMDKELRDVG
jgi:hypothetical protein